MEVFQTVMIVIRNVYITVMFIPLWLWSALIRTFPGQTWPYEHLDILSILVLLYGAFGLWFFAERTVVAHYSGKPTRGLTLCVWGIALLLFAECLGAVISRGSTTGWGSALFTLGTVALPLILLWSLQVDSHLREEEKMRPENTQPVDPESPQES